MGKSKLNPELMIGDEIIVVSTEGVHDFGTPNLFKPYVVVGIKHGTTMNREIHKWTHGEEDEEQTPDRWDSPEVPRSRLGFRKEFDTIPYTYYQIEPIGMTDEERTGAMLAGGGRMKPMYIFPSPNEYRGSDQWILRKGFRRGEHLTEHKETGLNPELGYGDTILIIDIDRERENGKTTYTTPGKEMRPERYVPYTVVDKETNGHKSQWPFRYTLVPQGQLEEYEKSLDRGWGNYEGYEKLLYPWIYQWIPADTPTATGVDRLTINEHQETKVSPDLEVGDVIRVLGVDGEHARMPDKWGKYKVQDVKQDNATQEIYYDIVPYPDPELPDMDYMEFHKETKVRSDQYWYRHGKTLYRGDTWIYDNVDKKTISEQKQEFNQPLTMGDVIRVVDVDKEATYEQPTYPYDTGNASGNSLMTPHHRGRLHGDDSYPRPMKLYAVMSKSMYRTKDRDYLNPYWMLWPVDNDGKVEAVKDFREIILTEKDTWMTIKKHHSNIPGDIEAKHKEYVDSGRDIISRVLDEQDEPIDTQGGEIIRGDTDNDYNDYSDEEIDKRKSYDSDDEMAEGDGKPFTPLETRILNTLHKYLTRSDLQSLSQETPPEYGELGKKFWDLMKMFGITPVNTEQDTRTSKYAKWALDNWTEEGDYGNIENPHKAPLGWYQIDREESGSQVEYKDGTAEVLGFDEDDASERGDYNFWDWGGEMETNDYGDYETYDSEITNAEFLRMDEGLGRVLRENTRVSDNFDDPLFLSMDKQKIQDLLFNYWRKFGPTLEDDKLKLLGFDMKSYDERAVVWDNLQEYYGDEELTNIIQDRLEGLHDSWNYEYIVTEWSMHEGAEIYLNILVNGDVEIPLSQESGGAIDMSLWDINEKSAEKGFDFASGHYEEVYDEVRSTISEDISEVVLKDLPVDVTLDYLDISEPGTFEEFVDQNEAKMITEDEGYLEDLVYRDEPKEKHIRRMDKDLGNLTGFPIEEFKNLNPPKNESDTTQEEIEQLKSIPVDNEFIESAEKVGKHFKKFLKPNGLEYPKEEIKSLLTGVKAIVLQLKYHYNRPRPWQISDVRGLCLDCDYGDLTSTPSYPSGHATEGRFVARYLSDLYPEYANELREIGDDIAYSRNMAKVHYPSDSAFGKLLGDAMYEYVSHVQLEPEMIHEDKMDEIPLSKIIGENINEQVMMKKVDMLKSDILNVLTNRFTLIPTDYSEIKDIQGNYYRLIDREEPDNDVNLSDLIEPAIEFVSSGIKSGDFEEEDMNTALTAITNWVSLEMNQKKEYIN